MPITSAVYQPRGVQTTPRLSDFKYALPERLIAQEPLPHRDDSRLMIVDRDTRRIVDTKFPDVVDYLEAGDCLVVNETRVFPARLRGYKEKTEAEIEVFLLRRLTEELWEVLVKPARKVRTGNTIAIGDCITCEVIDNTTSGGRVVRFHYKGDFADLVEKHGQPPLPPYIRREVRPDDRERYQTIFARVSGAVAAPTAGMHFTPDLVKKVKAKGVDVIPLILHVGLGTFRPVQVEDLSRHRMDSEYYEVVQQSVDRINEAIARGRRVIAVGTSVTRTLETVANFNGGIKTARGWTDKFIYPPYHFKVVDRLITNFHLPGSTLLMLVSAFADQELIMKAYRHAIREKYRFYSYGDAMLII
ncbi:tRNA preQ1(34) S-adenosylmethionine ribosyltransferase-isomerase QueA [bacterium]|nr:tRNA preQ1(34) S-adenosylmethionine ribosyltransferase-isomerase QueA [bacterium]MBU1984472.1 tRNA preQ1(34) S-adenosylmethionine ribosyltransferase-isomerase QueA [bacterium]